MSPPSPGTGSGAASPGQRAYAADLAIQPNHWDGSPRPAWVTLGRARQATWERNPTVKPRWEV